MPPGCYASSTLKLHRGPRHGSSRSCSDGLVVSRSSTCSATGRSGPSTSSSTRRVLIPRPETEVVVAVALSQLDRLCAQQPGEGVPALGAEMLVVDLGTGSGVIALSLVAERPSVRVIATDRDPAALEVASVNLSAVAATAAARVRLCEGDWYEALPGELAGNVALIVANPPYLSEREWAGLDPMVRGFDPFGALVAGPRGIEAIETIVAGAPAWLGRLGALVVEIAPDQAGPVIEMAREAGFPTASVEDDLAGRPRVLVAGP